MVRRTPRSSEKSSNLKGIPSSYSKQGAQEVGEGSKVFLGVAVRVEVTAERRCPQGPRESLSQRPERL